MISGDPTIITMSNTMLVKASEIMGINHSPLYLIWEDFWASWLAYQVLALVDICSHKDTPASTTLVIYILIIQ